MHYGSEMAYQFSSFWEKLKDHLEPVFIHTVAMSAAILSIWCVHWLLKSTLGESAKLFDLMPLIYVAHVGDTIVLGRFFWKMLKEF